jgi:hypothetical protein
MSFAALESRVNSVSAKHLGEIVQWKGLPISAKFDLTYLEPLSMVEGNKPALTVIATEFSGVKRGDSVTVRGVNYKITTVQPDGYGMLVLPLEKS